MIHTTAKTQSKPLTKKQQKEQEKLEKKFADFLEMQARKKRELAQLAAVDLHSYDRYVVAFSGGKDSVACVLYLLEKGVDRSKIELMHHEIDGREGSHLMDWPCTSDYVRKFAQAFNLPLFYSWKKGGFEGEMFRIEQRTAATCFEDIDPADPTKRIIREMGGTLGPLGTRLKFPQKTADLSVRWCSASLKINVGDMMLRNSARFQNCRTLLLTGERAAESSGRAKYEVFEVDRADNRTGKMGRHIDHLRPVKWLSDQQVWDLIERYMIRLHPAYYIGFGRVSCMKCIFANANQWATLNVIDPVGVTDIVACEDMFGVTIDQTYSVAEQIGRGKPYEGIKYKEPVELALSSEYTESIFLKEWVVPIGAKAEACGPL